MSLEKHIFYTKLLEKISSSTDMYNESTGEFFEVELWDTKNNHKPFSYLIKVLGCYQNFSKNHNEILMSTYFLKNCELFHKEKDLSEKVEYFVKNWILRVASHYDILISLINEVLLLGYIGRTITINNIENNLHVRENQELWELLTEIRKIIDNKILKQTKSKFQNNNEIKHLGSFSDNLIIDIGVIELEHSISSLSILDLVIDSNIAKNKLIPDIERDNLLIYKKTSLILDVLNSIFEKKFHDLLIDKI